MKRFLVFIVVFVMIFSSLPSTSLAETDPIQILDYSKAMDDGKLIVTARVKNNTASDKRVGVAAVGFDSNGNPLEARGGSYLLPKGSDDTIEIIMFAGELIKDVRLTAGKGIVNGKFEILGYGMYYSEEMKSYIGTVALENCTGVETNMSGALIGFDEKEAPIEARGNYIKAFPGDVSSIEVFMKAGSRFKSIKPAAGFYKTDKSFGILGYGSYYDSAKDITIVSMALENYDTELRQINGCMIGYGADGSALEAECSSTSIPPQGCSSIELEMKAGNRVSEVRPVLPKGTDSLLAFGAYYDEIKKETLVTSVFENASNSDKNIGGAVIAYDDKGKVIEVHGDNALASSKALVSIPLIFEAGKDIKEFRYSKATGSLEPEIVGCGTRIVDGKNIIYAVVETGAKEQKINLKVLYYNSQGGTVAERELTGFGDSGDMAEIYGVNTVDFSYDTIGFKYYDSNGTEITKQKNIQKIENNISREIKGEKAEEFKFQFSGISNSANKAEILDAVNKTYASMTTEQKENSKIKEDSLRYAEYAVQKMAKTDGPTINNLLKISADSLKGQVETVKGAKDEVLGMMKKNGMENNRELRAVVEIDIPGNSKEHSIELGKELADYAGDINKIKVVAGKAEVSIGTGKLSNEFKDKSKVTVNITKGTKSSLKIKGKGSLEDKVPASGVLLKNSKTIAADDSDDMSLELEFTDQAGNEISRLNENIEISIPTVEGDVDYQCVFKTDGQETEVVGGRYNEASGSIDVMVNESGTYYVEENRKTFKDVAASDMKLKKAIEVLASKGIINGKTDEEFQPNAAINRSEFATLIVKALYMANDDAESGFADVPSKAWFSRFVSAAKQGGLINGYEDNTFRGANIINNQEIIKVCAAVLNSQGGFYFADDEEKYLLGYSDAKNIPGWVRKYAALASREGIVVLRDDGLFVGGQPCTRGDAALMLYRLFERI